MCPNGDAKRAAGYIQTSGPGQQLSLSIWEALDWDIEAWGSPYFLESQPASVDCVNDTPPNSCSVCTPPQTSFVMYATLGSFKGTGKSLPSGVCGGDVYAGSFHTHVDANCRYDFSRGLQPPAYET